MGSASASYRLRPLQLATTGTCTTDIARRLAIPRSTVRDWLVGPIPRRAIGGSCKRCGGDHNFCRASSRVRAPAWPISWRWVYLRRTQGGLQAPNRPRPQVPGIIERTRASIDAVRSGSASVASKPHNCVEVYSYSKGWPCLFPQHGPGKKHLRPIVLTEWQRTLVKRRPEQLLRGLIESDGCRFQNTEPSVVVAAVCL